MVATALRPVAGDLPEAPGYRLDAVFVRTVAKEDAFPEANEDAVALDLDNDRAAVLDGATESFAAQRWTRIVAGQWTAGREDWLAAAQDELAVALDGARLTWAQESALARGSFCTIASAQALPGGLRLQAVGDSCVLLLRGSALVASFPLASATQFTSAPAALASDPQALDRCLSALDAGTVLMPVADGEVSHVLLATDALAAWLLNEDHDARAARLTMLLDAGSDDASFSALVAGERAAHRMKADDSTAVLLRLELAA